MFKKRLLTIRQSPKLKAHFKINSLKMDNIKHNLNLREIQNEQRKRNILSNDLFPLKIKFKFDLSNNIEYKKHFSIINDKIVNLKNYRSYINITPKKNDLFKNNISQSYKILNNKTQNRNRYINQFNNSEFNNQKIQKN